MRQLGPFGRRFVFFLLYIGMVTLIGTVGYLRIEGWGFADSLYMTVITLTAVGYEEVHPLTEAGRAFTMALLAMGITGMGAWFALITTLILEMDLLGALRRRKLMKSLKGLSEHVVLCGAGRTGRQVAEELVEAKESFVVIERDEDRVESLAERWPDLPVIHGDASQDQVLEEAGVDRARGLITCLSSDTDNLFVVLSARTINPELRIIARAYEEETMQKLFRAGADHVVSPNVTGALQMASVMVRPSVVSFLDVTTRSAEMSLRLEEVTIDPSTPFAGRSLAEARIPQETGLIVIAVRKHEEHERQFVFNPVGDTELDPGDQLIVLGSSDQVERLQKYVEG